VPNTTVIILSIISRNKAVSYSTSVPINTELPVTIDVTVIITKLRIAVEYINKPGWKKKCGFKSWYIYIVRDFTTRLISSG
jgi:hypothetical protein